MILSEDIKVEMFLSKITVINNIDSNIEYTFKKMKYITDKFTVGEIVCETPKTLTITGILKNIFNQPTIEIHYKNQIKKIKLKELLKNEMFNLVYNEIFDNLIIKVTYFRNKEKDEWYDVSIELKHKDRYIFSRHSSITDLSIHSSKSSNKETFSPQKQQRKYSKNYIPINQEQANYIESRAVRYSRSSTGSVNEHQSYPQSI